MDKCPAIFMEWDNVKVHPHYAVQQNATQHSFAMWQKLLGICHQINYIRLKNHFLITIFQFTKTVEQETHMHYMPLQKLGLTTADSKYRYGKPLMILTLCRSNFYAVRHSTICCGMQKLCWSHATLTSTLFSAFATQQSCVLLHSAARHNVDAPLGTNVTLCSYKTEKFVAPRNFFANSTCYTTQFGMVLHYTSVSTFRIWYLNSSLKSKMLLPVLIKVIKNVK